MAYNKAMNPAMNMNPTAGLPAAGAGQAMAGSNPMAAMMMGRMLQKGGKPDQRALQQMMMQSLAQRSMMGSQFPMRG